MKRIAAPLLVVLALLAAVRARAQPRPPRPLPQPSAGLRAHFGTEIATRLMRSSDANERLRGVQRAAAARTPEALALLERAAGAIVPGGIDPRMAVVPIEGVARNDPRALLAVVRGLAAWTDRETARAALSGILSAPVQSFATRVTSLPSADPAADEADGAARAMLARQEAAMALAESGDAAAVEALVAIARSGGPGQQPAFDALALQPPAAPVLGGVALTTPATIALAAEVGDLRALDAIHGVLSASDPLLRAAAIAALGVAGDARAAEVARAALHDPDGRVRLAATDALVHLSAPDAAGAVEALVADDAAPIDALRLAELVQGEGVTRAAAARAAASAAPRLRAAAVTALGRQTSETAVQALVTLLPDTAVGGDAALAIARSPCAAAMKAIEALAANDATRRLAARAYFVRRFVRGERSSGLDAVLASLAASRDPRDRAVGLEALVAFGEITVRAALTDSDPRVRRSVAMGAVARRDERSMTPLLERLSLETDQATRQVLAVGLAEGELDGVSWHTRERTPTVPTLALLDRVEAGGADAFLAALELGRRADDTLAPRVDALLASHDPVMRAHAALGLGASAAPDAAGRLAAAYAWEADAGVRRSIVHALASRTGDARAPARRDTLNLAARLDPDRGVRWMARRALAGGAGERVVSTPEVAWLRLVPAAGASPLEGMTGALVVPGGLGLPVAFDDEGFALLPGIPAGEASLRLGPRLPAYEAPSP